MPNNPLASSQTSSQKKRINLLYFASLGESLNCTEENLDIDASLSTINDLKNLLAQREGAWKNFACDASILCAQNQEIASPSASINDGDEIAFFPPVTGG